MHGRRAGSFDGVHQLHGTASAAMNQAVSRPRCSSGVGCLESSGHARVRTDRSLFVHTRELRMFFWCDLATSLEPETACGAQRRQFCDRRTILRERLIFWEARGNESGI